VSTSDDRERGFTRRLAKAGFKITLRLHGHSTYEGGHAAGCRVAALSPEERPDAVFVLNDIMAMGFLDASREAGLRVPDDLSVVGFDDVPAAARRSYALTTVAQPMQAMVRRGLDLLAARILDPTLPDETVTLRGRLVIRASARKPATGHEPTA